MPNSCASLSFPNPGQFKGGSNLLLAFEPHAKDNWLHHSSIPLGERHQCWRGIKMWALFSCEKPALLNHWHQRNCSVLQQRSSDGPSPSSTAVLVEVVWEFQPVPLLCVCWRVKTKGKKKQHAHTHLQIQINCHELRRNTKITYLYRSLIQNFLQSSPEVTENDFMPQQG